MASRKDPSSFRDPSGFVFYGEDGSLYRQVNNLYRAEYDMLMSSGLYDRLVKERLLIPHQEVDNTPRETDDAYRVIQPERVPFISYPYEWCFSQLKDAALLTLKIQRLALEYGMILKDASAYNLQFFNGGPIFIDTLSFGIYKPGKPWSAYRQFCQHFLAPLALMSKQDIRSYRLQRPFLDGIPLDFAVKLLPARVFLRPGLFIHLYLHAKSQGRKPSRATLKSASRRSVPKATLVWLINGLEAATKSLQWKPAGTQWVDYYSDDSYTKEALSHKLEIVEQYLDESRPTSVWDLGANTGLYSALASKRGIPTISMDSDEGAVENQYLQLKNQPDANRLPLLIDLMNPSPACGWNINERASLFERGPADIIFALALVHHLAIGNNVPLPDIAEVFSKLCRRLIIEFVPKEDKKPQTMLALREDVFSNYSQAYFEQAFKKFFTIRNVTPINDSLRVMYLMEKI